jgi:replicative DNA helicase
MKLLISFGMNHFIQRSTALFLEICLSFSANLRQLISFLLSSTLRDKNLLEQVGGATYLTELVNTVPSAANAKHYAEIVQKKHLMRKLIECSEEITGLAMTNQENLMKFLIAPRKNYLK